METARPASADVQSVITMNRTLYERARAMGGTRLTTTAIPFSQADWIRHHGPVWESFRRAKERFDPAQCADAGTRIVPQLSLQTVSRPSHPFSDSRSRCSV